MKTSEVLYKAADLIEERGWVQGEGWPVAGEDEAPLCLEGGIAAALGMEFPASGVMVDYDSLLRCPAFQAVRHYLDWSRGLFQWNDHSARTAPEVIATLRAAAVIEAAKENPTAANSPATHADTASEAVTG